MGVYSRGGPRDRYFSNKVHFLKKKVDSSKNKFSNDLVLVVYPFFRKSFFIYHKLILFCIFLLDFDLLHNSGPLPGLCHSVPSDPPSKSARPKLEKLSLCQTTRPTCRNSQ